MEGEVTVGHGAGEEFAVGVSVPMMADVRVRKTVKEVEPSPGKKKMVEAASGAPQELRDDYNVGQTSSLGNYASKSLHVHGDHFLPEFIGMSLKEKG